MKPIILLRVSNLLWHLCQKQILYLLASALCYVGSFLKRNKYIIFIVPTIPFRTVKQIITESTKTTIMYIGERISIGKKSSFINNI